MKLPACGCRKEKGSVLVVCIGVLAILSLMAVAFVSTMQLQKAVGGNVKNAVSAEMAARSGFTRAIATLMSTPNDYFSPTQAWYTVFNSAAPNDAEVFPSEYGINATTLEHAGNTFGRGKWHEISGIADPNMKARYAVAVVDLSSLLHTNRNSASSTWDVVFERFSSKAAVADTTDVAAATWIPDKTDFSNTWGAPPAPYLSINHGAYVLGSTSNFYDSFLTYVTPWGMPSVSYKGGTGPNTELSPININTASFGVLNKIISKISTLPSLDAPVAASFAAIKIKGTVAEYRYSDGPGCKDLLGTPDDGVVRDLEAALNFTGATGFKLDVVRALNHTFKQPRSEAEHIATFLEQINAGNLKNLVENEPAVPIETAINDVLRVAFGYTNGGSPGREFVDFDGRTPVQFTAVQPPLVPELYAGRTGFFYIAVRGQTQYKANSKVAADRSLEAVIKVYDDAGIRKHTILFHRWFQR